LAVLLCCAERVVQARRLVLVAPDTRVAEKRP
jgi:hypothetical protein